MEISSSVKDLVFVVSQLLRMSNSINSDEKFFIFSFFKTLKSLIFCSFSLDGFRINFYNFLDMNYINYTNLHNSINETCQVSKT